MNQLIDSSIKGKSQSVIKQLTTDWLKLILQEHEKLTEMIMIMKNGVHVKIDEVF